MLCSFLVMSKVMWGPSRLHGSDVDLHADRIVKVRGIEMFKTCDQYSCSQETIACIEILTQDKAKRNLNYVIFLLDLMLNDVIELYSFHSED
jgi:hypothetical protein